MKKLLFLILLSGCNTDNISPKEEVYVQLEFVNNGEIEKSTIISVK